MSVYLPVDGNVLERYSSLLSGGEISLIKR